MMAGCSRNISIKLLTLVTCVAFISQLWSLGLREFYFDYSSSSSISVGEVSLLGQKEFTDHQQVDRANHSFDHLRGNISIQSPQHNDNEAELIDTEAQIVTDDTKLNGMRGKDGTHDTDHSIGKGSIGRGSVIKKEICQVNHLTDNLHQSTGMIYTTPESNLEGSKIDRFARAGKQGGYVNSTVTQRIMNGTHNSSEVFLTKFQRMSRSGILEIPSAGNDPLLILPGWGPHSSQGLSKTIHWPSYTTAFLDGASKSCFWPLVPQITDETTNTSSWVENKEQIIAKKVLVSGGMMDGLGHAMIVLNAWCLARKEKDVSFLVQSIHEEEKNVPSYLYNWSNALGIDRSRIIFHYRQVVAQEKVFAAPWEDVHTDWSCLHDTLKKESADRSIAIVCLGWEKNHKSKQRDIPTWLHNKLVDELSTSLGISVVTFNGTETLEETRDLFSRAKIVIGPHGAGFVNLVFCDSSTPVVELINPSLLSQPWQMYGGQSFGIPWWPVLVDSFDNEAEVMRSVAVANRALQFSEQNVTTEEIQPRSKQSLEETLSLETVDPCVMDILSRHNLPKKQPPINPTLGFDAVFVIHYTPLVDRKNATRTRVLDTFGVEPIFVEAFDRENITDEDVKCFGNSEAQQAFIQRVSKKGEYSVNMKHFAVYFYMIEHLNIENALVIEDDASFLQSDWTSSSSIYQTIRKDLPSSYDLLLICAFGDNRLKGRRITDHVYLAQESRQASAYLVSQKGARNMMRSLPMVAPIDWQMNYAANHQGNLWMKKLPGFHGPRTVDIEVYHSHPPLSRQLNQKGRTWLD